MNKKIIISISIIITISIIIFSLSQSEIIEEKELSQNEVIEEKELSQNEVIEEKELSQNEVIEEKLKQIIKDKIKNDQSVNPYIPKEREWIKSGPFMIDRSEYLLGEKIFINMVNLDEDTKGQMVFVKSINMTHFFEYKKISFNGEHKTNGNLYLPIHLNGFKGICTTDQLVGDWGIWFEGTDIQPLYFKIKDQIIPGIEDQFEPVC
jgi:hypothetical protein